MIGIHWTYKCTHCFVVYVSQIMPYASNFHNAVSILSQWNWKGKKGETTCKGPSHTESPTKSQSKPPCFLFLTQTPLEDHHCLGHRPELEPAHSTLLRKPRKRCTRRLRLAAADPPTSPFTAPLACSQTNYWPSSSFSTVLTPVCSAWNMRPSGGLLPLLHGAAPLRSPPDRHRPPRQSHRALPSGSPVVSLLQHGSHSAVRRGVCKVASISKLSGENDPGLIHVCSQQHAQTFTDWMQSCCQVWQHTTRANAWHVNRALKPLLLTEQRWWACEQHPI